MLRHLKNSDAAIIRHSCIGSETVAGSCPEASRATLTTIWAPHTQTQIAERSLPPPSVRPSHGRGIATFGTGHIRHSGFVVQSTRASQLRSDVLPDLSVTLSRTRWTRLAASDPAIAQRVCPVSAQFARDCHKPCCRRSLISASASIQSC